MPAALRKRPCRFCLRWFLPDVRQREKQYACLIKPHLMTKYDALAEIDRLMQLKLTGTAAAIAK